MEYLHKCSHCGYWNLLDYSDYTGGDNSGNIKQVNPDGVDTLARTVQPGTFQFVCKKCGKPLDRWYNGSFVAKYPNRTANMTGTRGYRLSQLNCVWISADKLKADEMNSKSKQSFYNYNLGMPYADTKLQVADSDITDNGHFPDRKENRDGYSLISAGIDWGSTGHSVIVLGMRPSGDYELLNIFHVNAVAPTDAIGAGTDIEAIRVRLAPYNPDIIMADVGDSGERIQRLINIYGKDKVFGAKYSSNPTMGLYKASGAFEPSWNENSNVVTLDKLVMNKRFIDMMKHGEIGFWSRPDEALQTYITHWKNVVIRDEEQNDGEMRQVIGRRGPDHYAQASIIALIGMDRLREDVYGEDNYEFDYTRLESEMQPEQTPLASQVNNQNIFS